MPARLLWIVYEFIRVSSKDESIEAQPKLKEKEKLNEKQKVPMLFTEFVIRNGLKTHERKTKKKIKTFYKRFNNHHF